MIYFSRVEFFIYSKVNAPTCIMLESAHPVKKISMHDEELMIAIMSKKFHVCANSLRLTSRGLLLYTYLAVKYEI